MIADRIVQRLLGEARGLRDDRLRLVAELGHRAHQKDAVCRVGGRHQHVRVARLQLLHFRGQRWRIGAIFHIRDDLVAARGRKFRLHIRRIRAEDRVLVEQRKRVDLLSLLAQHVHEVEHGGGEHFVMCRCAVEKLESALVEAGRGRIRAHERHGVALAGLAYGRRDGAVVAADDRRHLVLRDQAFGFRAALLRIALVVGIDDLDLLSAEPRETRVLGERQIEVGLRVDDGQRRLDRIARIDSGLRRRTRHREHGADDDLVCRIGPGRSQARGERGRARECFTTIEFHALAPVVGARNIARRVRSPHTACSSSPSPASTLANV